jgi:hypothetical protein
MKVDECINCEFHVERLPDSILCKFTSELEHHVLSESNIVGCPRPMEKKGFKKLFH